MKIKLDEVTGALVATDDDGTPEDVLVDMAIPVAQKEIMAEEQPLQVRATAAILRTGGVELDPIRPYAVFLKGQLVFFSKKIRGERVAAIVAKCKENGIVPLSVMVIIDVRTDEVFRPVID